MSASYANKESCVIFLAIQYFQPLIGNTVYLISQSVENFDTIRCMRLTVSMHGNHKGFTLIELLITLAIAAILITLAVPNFSGLIQNNRLITQTNSLIADLNFARSEAIKRARSISIQAIDDNWANGLIIKLPDATDDDFLRQSAASETGISISTTNGDSVTFSASGSVIGTLSSLTICDTRGDDFGRVISISATGRAAISSDTADCN